MKKLTLFVAFALATSFAMSQNNTSSVWQDGGTNKATVNQTGATNTAAVEQFGRNDAKVDQLGISNDAVIKEGTSADHVSNYLDNGWNGGVQIMQNGKLNKAKTEIYHVVEYGTGNGNGTKIDQSGNENQAAQYITSFLSQTAAAAARQAVEIIQIGDLNQAAQTTVPSFGMHGIQQMWIDQIGNGNHATQNSIGGAGSSMKIYQKGGGNTSTQNQNQAGGSAYAKIIGDGNTTQQDQTYSVWALSGRNDASIDILGGNNTSTQTQLGEYNLSSTSVVGDGNISLTNQLGDSNTAIINQRGNSNYGFTSQSGISNISGITQLGNNNWSSVTQQH